MLTLVLFSTLMQVAPPADAAAQVINDPANVLISIVAARDWEPAADAASEEWAGIPGVQASKDFFGEKVALRPTEIRSRWTQKNLYLLFVCPYRKLYTNPHPVRNAETNELWKWDVAEAFIGSDYLNMASYKEFQVSPLGEYVDLDINLDDRTAQKGVEWQSGFSVAAKIDPKRKIWYGEMKIPFSSLDVKTPAPGDQLRIGLFRIEGPEPHRIYVTWRPTGATTFHVPSAFGSLVLK